MKKISYVLLAAMLVVAMFVSCKAEVIDDADLVDIRFVSEDNGKGLTWSRPGFDASVYTWYYTAEKADEGPKTGETMTEKKVGENGDLSEDTGPLSQGKWKFVLFGYSGDVLVYKGSVETTISKSSNSVTVVVSAQTSGEGTILISKDINFKDASENPNSFAPTDVKILTVSDVVVRSEGFDSTNGNSFVLDSGAYKVVVYREVDGITYASNTIYVNVYDGQTTTIGGTLDESTTSAKFVAEDGQTVSETSNKVSIEKDSETIIKVGVTPINEENTETSVSFPAGALGAGKNAVLKVVAYPTSVATTFSVLPTGDVPVVGIDLSVTVDGSEVKDFGTNAVTVTTYVTKGLTSRSIGSAAEAVAVGLKVVYNGDGDQPTILSYDKDSGKLVFTTTHFSQYYVTSSEIEACNITTNTAYTSLVDAINAVDNGRKNTIVVSKDISLAETVKINGGKSIEINLNGKTITKDSRPFKIGNAKVDFTGKGTIAETKSDNYAAIQVYGSNTDVKDYTVVSIGKDVTLKGWSGIFVALNAEEEYNHYGLVVNLYGKIIVPAEFLHAAGYGLYINGQCKVVDGNVPTFNIDGASIVARNSGIYSAGYAKWNIKDTTIAGVETAIEIRAGELNIDGGSFEATATSYECEANGNGTTTSGAAIAVAQHSTGLPINVCIKNATLKGAHGLAVENPQKNVYEVLSQVRVEFDSSVGTPHYDSAYFVNEGNVITAKTV